MNYDNLKLKFLCSDHISTKAHVQLFKDFNETGTSFLRAIIFLNKEDHSEVKLEYDTKIESFPSYSLNLLLDYLNANRPFIAYEIGSNDFFEPSEERKEEIKNDFIESLSSKLKS